MIKYASAVALTAALTFTAPAPAAVGATEQGTVHGSDQPDAIPGSYIVLYRTAAPAGLDLTTRAAIKVDHRFAKAARGFAARMDAREAKRLAAHPDVAVVEQNRVVRLDAPPSAPAQSTLTADPDAKRDGGVVVPNGPAIPVPPMGRGVTVYVLDTGVRVTHASFSTPPAWGANTAGGPDTDCNGHGTHVAGIVSGSFNERWSSPRAQLVAVKVLDCVGSGTLAGIIAGVDWVTAHRTGPSIANMSLGGLDSPSLDQAVRNSIASGITYVVAAGNHNANACYFSPARVTEAITVAAVHGLGRRAWFSNHGGCVDVFSHGVGVRSAWHTGDTATAVLAGTSMAAPHIAALASNYLSANPTATPAQVRGHIVGAATAGQVIDPGPGSPNLMTIGHLDPFPAAPTVSAGCSSSAQMLSCDAWASGTVTDYWWFVDGSPAASGPSITGGCSPGWAYSIRVIAGNSGGASEAVTSLACSSDPPV